MSSITFDNFVLLFIKKVEPIFSSINVYLSLNLSFYIFFIFTICFFATVLILNNNPMFSVICLILVYLSASFFLLCIEVQFLSVIFILVYLGAVVVLFLFVVMMLNLKTKDSSKLSMFLPIVLIVFIYFYLLIYNNNLNFQNQNNTNINQIILNFKDILTINFYITEVLSNILNLLLINNNLLYTVINCFFLENLNYNFENFYILAYILYTYYFLELLLSAFILLVAMVGCLSLTLLNEQFSLKKQDSMVQILNKNTIFLKNNIKKG